MEGESKLVSSARLDMGVAVVDVELFRRDPPTHQLWAKATVVKDNEVKMEPMLELVEQKPVVAAVLEYSDPRPGPSRAGRKRKGPGRPRKNLDIPTQCPFCPRSCPNQATMKRHLAIHSGEMACPLQPCDARYKNQTSVTKHLREAHGIELSRPQDKISLARRKAERARKEEAKRLGQCQGKAKRQAKCPVKGKAKGQALTKGRKAMAKKGKANADPQSPVPGPSWRTNENSNSSSSSSSSDSTISPSPSFSNFSTDSSSTPETVFAPAYGPNREIFNSTSSAEMDPALVPAEASGSVSSSEVFPVAPEQVFGEAANPMEASASGSSSSEIFPAANPMGCLELEFLPPPKGEEVENEFDDGSYYAELVALLPENQEIQNNVEEGEMQLDVDWNSYGPHYSHL